MDVKITIRVPDEVHQALRDAAGDDSRSLNGEIVYLLKCALAAR